MLGAAMARPAVLMHATRGTPGLLHHAASTGDTAKLQLLLRQITSTSAGIAPEIDRGDHRRYTPFATACAGGHAACVSLLLAAGCDTSLLCDTGLTGWDLAQELHRAEVVALQQVSAAQGSDAAAGGDDGRYSSSCGSGGRGPKWEWC